MNLAKTVYLMRQLDQSGNKRKKKNDDGGLTPLIWLPVKLLLAVAAGIVAGIIGAVVHTSGGRGRR